MKAKLTGKVAFSMKEHTEDKSIIMLYVPEEEEAKKDFLYELQLNPTITTNPIKEGTNENVGKLLLKATSIYPVNIYLDGKQNKELSLTDISRGSIVEIQVDIKTGEYKKEPYQVCYLKAINILKLVEYNPFI